MKFNEKLPKLRSEKHISQEQLADMLDVSRQAVSKWESGQTYPEMDKLIMISKIFNCSLDDLTNDEVGIDTFSKKKTSVSNWVDELFSFIKKTINMCRVMRKRDILKCIFTMAMIFCVLLLCYFPVVYFNNLGSEAFASIGLEDQLGGLWGFLLNVAYTVLFAIVYVYIYKVLYLDRYEGIITNEEPETITKKGKKIKVEETERKVVRAKEVSTNFLKPLASIMMWFIKFFMILVGIPFVLCLLVLCAMFIVGIYLLFRGVIYIGILLGIVFAAIFAVMVIMLIFYFLCNRKLEIKKVFLTFLISIIGMGISIGIGTIEIASTDFIDTVPMKTTTTFKEYDFNTNLVIEAHGGYNFVADESLKDKVIIEIEQYTQYSEIYFDNTITEDRDIIWISIYEKRENIFSKEFRNMLIRDLRNKRIQNYGELFRSEITIYTSQTNYDMLMNNLTEYRDALEEQAFQDDINHYQEEINVCYENSNSLENRLIDKEELITKLESEIEMLKSELQEYKDRIKELLD